MAENRWLQLSFTLGLAVGLLRITRAVLFLAFVRYQQHHRQKVFNWDTTFVQGDWHSKI